MGYGIWGLLVMRVVLFFKSPIGSVNQKYIKVQAEKQGDVRDGCVERDRVSWRVGYSAYGVRYRDRDVRGVRDYDARARDAGGIYRAWDGVVVRRVVGEYGDRFRYGEVYIGSGIIIWDFGIDDYIPAGVTKYVGVVRK